MPCLGVAGEDVAEAVEVRLDPLAPALLGLAVVARRGERAVVGGGRRSRRRGLVLLGVGGACSAVGGRGPDGAHEEGRQHRQHAPLALPPRRAGERRHLGRREHACSIDRAQQCAARRFVLATPSRLLEGQIEEAHRAAQTKPQH